MEHIIKSWLENVNIAHSFCGKLIMVSIGLKKYNLKYPVYVF